jgi:hypothetical protein
LRDLENITTNKTIFVLTLTQIKSTNGQKFAEIDGIVPITKIDVSLRCCNKEYM